MAERACSAEQAGHPYYKFTRRTDQGNCSSPESWIVWPTNHSTLQLHPYEILVQPDQSQATTSCSPGGSFIWPYTSVTLESACCSPSLMTPAAGSQRQQAGREG